MHSPLPILALLFNALVWGLAWWPLRRMFDAGLHPLWATAVMYAMVLAALLALRTCSRSPRAATAALRDGMQGAIPQQ